MSARLRGPWGAFAAVSGTSRKGRVVLRLRPSGKAAAKAAAALAERRAVALRLTIAVRAPSGETQTVTRTLRLVR